jgi:hypothetical protein
MDWEESKKNIREALEEIIREQYNESITEIALSSTTEEDLIATLAEIHPERVGLDYFVDLGAVLLENEKYELVKIVKTHIEYNFNAKLVTKNGVSTYEIY